MNRNNFDTIRLIAASLVLYGHSFVFLGLREPLFLSWIPLGPLGVYIFFTISGYLISQSWDRDRNFKRFIIRRFLRIFPGLSVCIALSILLLGPLLTTLTLHEYFTNFHTFGYLRNIGLFIVYYLPGVYETNRVANAVNGSLWSLPIEFSLYIITGLIGLVCKGRWCILALAAGYATICFQWAWKTEDMLVIYGSDMRQLFICGTYFWVGALLHKFNFKNFMSIPVALGAATIMLCLEPYGSPSLKIASWILLPIIIFSFGLSHSKFLEKLTTSGDYSYGIYIYAFPIQQAIVYLNPKIGIAAYLTECFIVTVIFAVLSWHLIEKKMLMLKPLPPPINPLNLSRNHTGL